MLTILQFRMDFFLTELIPSPPKWYQHLDEFLVLGGIYSIRVRNFPLILN